MSEPRWLAEHEADAWLDLVAVAELLPAALDTQLHRDSQLSFFDYFTLSQLAETDDHSMRISDLAAQTNATVARMSRVASRLEADGLLERMPDATDARARRAAITGRGVTALDEAASGHVDLVRRLFADALTADQMNDLSSICRVLLSALDPDRVMFTETLAGRSGRAGLSSRPRSAARHS